MRSYTDWCSILKDESFPCAIVDLDAFDANTDDVAKRVEMANSTNRYRKTPITVRLATKSIRVPDLIKRALSRHPKIFKGLMCYDAREIQFLASHGFDDFLLAYPTLQKTDLEILRKLHESGKCIRLVVDHEVHLLALKEAMQGIVKPFEIVLDVDMSLRLLGGVIHLGVRRSSLVDVEKVETFLSIAKKVTTLKIVGVMGYEAQVAGLQDENPFKKLMSPIYRLVRYLSTAYVAKKRRILSGIFEKSGFEMQLYNGGGSGSLDFSLKENALTEVTVGSGLMGSHLFDYYSNISFKPALFFALDVCRFPSSSHVTVRGGGYISSGSVGEDKQPMVHLPAGLKPISDEGFGEVQTPFSVSNSHFKELYDSKLVLFRPAKAGELAERFNEYTLVDGTKKQTAKTYRGFGGCYL